MKLLLLHGPGINSSRSKLLELKKKFHPDNIRVFDRGEDGEEILVNLVSPSLFAGERLVILENPPTDLSVPALDRPDLTLILWFAAEVGEKKPVVESAKRLGEVLFFPEVKEITAFPFLDKLAYKQKQAYLELDKLIKKGYDSAYITTMIYYLLRSLAVTPKNSPAFVKQKLIEQKNNFSFEQLRDLYQFTLETDFKIKKGQLDQSQAQFMLVNRFLS